MWVYTSHLWAIVPSEVTVHVRPTFYNCTNKMWVHLKNHLDYFQKTVFDQNYLVSVGRKRQRKVILWLVKVAGHNVVTINFLALPTVPSSLYFCLMNRKNSTVCLSKVCGYCHLFPVSANIFSFWYYREECRKRLFVQRWLFLRNLSPGFFHISIGNS